MSLKYHSLTNLINVKKKSVFYKQTKWTKLKQYFMCIVISSYKVNETINIFLKT